jgi:hypothetical protein
MKMNVESNEQAQNRPPSRFILIATLLILFFVTACTGQGATETQADPTEITAPPDPAIEPPPAVLEQPLKGDVVDVPAVWLVPSLQSKEALADFLMIGIDQLDWINPGLPDQVPPGTLIVVPPNAFAIDTGHRSETSGLTSDEVAQP